MSTKSRTQILHQIERKRLEMIQAALHKGLTNEDTVRLSEELDALLNLHQQTNHSKCNWKMNPLSICE